MPSQSSDELLRAAMLADRPPELKADVKALLSQGGAMFWLLGEIGRLSAERASRFARGDLISEQGRAQALQNQGELRGFELVINLILDTQTETDNGRPE